MWTWLKGDGEKEDLGTETESRKKLDLRLWLIKHTADGETPHRPLLIKTERLNSELLHFFCWIPNTLNLQVAFVVPKCISFHYIITNMYLTITCSSEYSSDSQYSERIYTKITTDLVCVCVFKIKRENRKCLWHYASGQKSCLLFPMDPLNILYISSSVRTRTHKWSHMMLWGVKASTWRDFWNVCLSSDGLYWDTGTQSWTTGMSLYSNWVMMWSINRRGQWHTHIHIP